MRVLVAMAVLAAVTSAAPPAAGQSMPGVDEPMPRPAVPAIPDASFRAVKNMTVTVRTRSGSVVTGRLIAEESGTITLVSAPSGDVVTLLKVEVLELRSSAAQPVQPGQPAAPAVPEIARERHFGLLLGLAPAVNLDLDYGLFYGFLNGSFVLPAASDGNLIGLSVGGGVNFSVSANRQLKLEVFAHFSPARYSEDQWRMAFGVGLGLHYTFRSGFTLGFKTPIFGYSEIVSTCSSPYPYGCSNSHQSSGEGVAFYYLSSVMGLPMMSLGYRF